MYFIVPWDLWFYMRKFCITLTPFSYRKNLYRENLYYVLYRVALLWWHHWKHCHWWNAEWTQWLLAYITCTTLHFHRCKQKLDFKNEAWFLGYSSIKVDFFFVNRGSFAHACIDTYGNDVLIHILLIMRMKNTLVVPGNTTVLWLVPSGIF